MSDLRAIVELAREPSFRLGPARVEPSNLRLVSPTGDSMVLQPRVMQVLVALHRAHGATLSRDDLNAACWGGRIVGDDALDRAIGQLRRFGEWAGHAYRIETIPRVGFRLVGSIAAMPHERSHDAHSLLEFGAIGVVPPLSPDQGLHVGATQSSRIG